MNQEDRNWFNKCNCDYTNITKHVSSLFSLLNACYISKNSRNIRINRYKLLKYLDIFSYVLSLNSKSLWLLILMLRDFFGFSVFNFTYMSKMSFWKVKHMTKDENEPIKDLKPLCWFRKFSQQFWQKIDSCDEVRYFQNDLTLLPWTETQMFAIV